MSIEKEKAELLQGTLDMLILKALQLEPMHGFGLSIRLAQLSKGVFQVEMGSQGWVKAKWGVSENNRRARFYEITAAGRKQLEAETEEWALLSSTINAVLRAT